MGQEQSANNKIALQPYKTAMTRYMRSLLTLRGVTYPQLATKLEQRGIQLTPEHLRNKISKGLVPTDLFIVIIEELDDSEKAVIEIGGLAKVIQEGA